MLSRGCSGEEAQAGWLAGWMVVLCWAMGVLRVACADGDHSCSCGGGVPQQVCLVAAVGLTGWLLAASFWLCAVARHRYDVTACPTKVVPGLYGFVAQLNEGRYSKKRPTEFRVDQVVQPFDPSKFNFTKVRRAVDVCCGVLWCAVAWRGALFEQWACLWAEPGEGVLGTCGHVRCCLLFSCDNPLEADQGAAGGSIHRRVCPLTAAGNIMYLSAATPNPLCSSMPHQPAHLPAFVSLSLPTPTAPCAATCRPHNTTQHTGLQAGGAVCL